MNPNADMMELVDIPDLKSGSLELCGFESRCPHQIWFLRLSAGGG